ncbi:MAG: PDZ domain-containing protein [Chloroflexi bacterium]|nr:MAG: PDZ domain-containing protein [Chloroflexota bacterium]
MKRYMLIAVLVTICLLLAACSPGAGLARPAISAPAATATIPAAPVISPAPAPGTLAALEGALEQIYDRVNPSVVNIRVVQKEEVALPSIPEIPGFPFFGPLVPQGPQEFYQRGLGSGFVWDKQGHIVTNNHVVEGADKITVTFYDGTTVAGTVVGADPDSDLAVVKVDVPADRLHPVILADSTKVKVGQLAIAIGNPFGLEGTMTHGIVSAVGRLLPVQRGNTPGPSFSIPDVIQTDAPINPGNSGGVLLDDQGRVIGVTSAIESPVRANAGIGFAIPSAIVQKVVPALIETGHYEHAWLGISGITLSPDLAKAMDLSADQRGALVIDVVPDSPADKAGLRGSDRQVEIEGQQVRVGGDVIVAIDRQPVKGIDDLVTYLTRNTDVGQTVTLTVLRNGKEETVKVKLAARPERGPQEAVVKRVIEKGAWLGIEGVTLTPEIAQAMGLPEDQQGVLIERVAMGSPADKAGLRGSYKPTTIEGQRMLVGGDVIIAVDDQPVTQVEDLAALLKQRKPGQKVTVTLLRDGKRIQVPVTLDEPPATEP